MYIYIYIYIYILSIYHIMYMCVYIYISHILNQFSVDGHLGCFEVFFDARRM